MSPYSRRRSSSSNNGVGDVCSSGDILLSNCSNQLPFNFSLFPSSSFASNKNRKVLVQQPNNTRTANDTTATRSSSTTCPSSPIVAAAAVAAVAAAAAEPISPERSCSKLTNNRTSATTAALIGMKRQRSSETSVVGEVVQQQQQQEQKKTEQHVNGDDELNIDELNAMHPREYARLTFKRNGYDTSGDEKDCTMKQDCVNRFVAPSQEQLDAYGTEILTAVRSNDVEKAKALYQDGVFNCNACNRFGESILHIACRRGHFQMVQFLIHDVGLTVHTIRDDYYRTPLHDAFWTSKASPSVIDFLLQQPYVVELLVMKDKRGYTPLDYARLEDKHQWITFLQQRKHLLVPTDNKNDATATEYDSIQSNDCAVLNSNKRQKLPVQFIG